MQMPLPVLNMPAPTVGVAVMPVCEKSRMRDCHSRDGTTETMQDMMGIFSPIFGQHYSPVLSMLRRDPCGDWGGEDERNVRDANKRLRNVIGICQRAAWKIYKAFFTAR